MLLVAWYGRYLDGFVTCTEDNVSDDNLYTYFGCNYDYSLSINSCSVRYRGIQLLVLYTNLVTMKLIARVIIYHRAVSLKFSMLVSKTSSALLTISMKRRTMLSHKNLSKISNHFYLRLRHCPPQNHKQRIKLFIYRCISLAHNVHKTQTTDKAHKHIKQYV